VDILNGWQIMPATRFADKEADSGQYKLFDDPGDPVLIIAAGDVLGQGLE
jgi:hypothetical protein